MAIYELHVRDFSDNDGAARRAPRQVHRLHRHEQPNGMRHLRALAQAGLTDVHLMPSLRHLRASPRSAAARRGLSSGAPDSPRSGHRGRTASNRLLQLGLRPVPLLRRRKAATRLSVADGTTRVIEFRRYGAVASTRPDCAWAWTSSSTTPAPAASPRTPCSTRSFPATTTGSTPGNVARLDLLRQHGHRKPDDGPPDDRRGATGRANTTSARSASTSWACSRATRWRPCRRRSTPRSAITSS